MGNIVSSLILNSFQRQETLFNILFKPDEIDDEENPMAGPEDQDQQGDQGQQGDQDQQEDQGQQFPPVDHHALQPEPNNPFLHLVLPNDVDFFLENSINLDLIDPSKHDPSRKIKPSSEPARFCHITRIKAAEASSNEILDKMIGHTAVWFQDQMIVWGGYNNDRDTRYLPADMLRIYDPLIDTW